MNLLDIGKDAVETMLRFFPFSTGTGLRTVGQPGPDSPVLVTGNFDLTVRRVLHALDGLDCYLLVAPSKGINVWCAACGGHLSAHSVSSVVKTSRIADRVAHRTLILPQLSAPGIDLRRLERETGWSCKFGPVYARDIPEYLAAGGTKRAAMHQVAFPLVDRLQMAVMWAAPMSVVAAVPVALLSPKALPGALALIWSFSVVLFSLYQPLMRNIPGPVGLTKTLLLGLVGVAIVTLLGGIVGRWEWTAVFAWSLGVLVVALVLGFDLDGSSPLTAGATVTYWAKRWPKVLDLWARFGYEIEPWFLLSVATDRCNGCGRCVEVCPKGVFELYRLEGGVKSRLQAPSECEQCTACVKQCPEGAVMSDPIIRGFEGSIA